MPLEIAEERQSARFSTSYVATSHLQRTGYRVLTKYDLRGGPGTTCQAGDEPRAKLRMVYE